MQYQANSGNRAWVGEGGDRRRVSRHKDVRWGNFDDPRRLVCVQEDLCICAHVPRGAYQKPVTHEKASTA